METKLNVGLVRGHAYSFTGVKNVPLKGTGLFSMFNRETIQMVRLRNPWGGTEWTGPWSDGAPEWTKVSEREKKELGLTFDENGEFWMAFDDFCRYFTHIDICHMMNTAFFTLKRSWKETTEFGEWRRGGRAGGCGNHQTFLENPQYLLEVYEDQEMRISLEQEDRRSSNFRTRGENYCIGFSITKTDLNRKYRMHDRMERVHSGSFVQARSILARMDMKKGKYLLVPSTFDPNQEGEYLLRIYSEGGMALRKLTKDVPSPPRMMKKPKIAATSVTVHAAEGFTFSEGETGIEAYCIIKCEKDQVKTSITEKHAKPEWKERVTFYRQNQTEDVVVEVWDDNLLKDSLVGSVTFPMEKSHEYTGGNIIRRYPLMKSNAEGVEELRGFLWASIKHTTNLMDV
ncbi:hypothetical protein EGW08_022174 [Elysia chlorotica]|uniref:Uncharacterized protein n=1 Tax=Elysia chlorotica TaxID=188477 RepID=A0A3S1AWD4_ELYCH|nr:hypothetical protein EGW08_022174 [Elysia chlorotica]